MALTILGLSGALSHDPSAALYIDGKLIAAAEEERFVRDKHAKNRMPYESAKFCLEQAGIKPSDVDVVAIPFAPISLFGEARWHYAKRYWYAPDRALDAILMGNRRYKRYRNKIVWCLEQLGFDPKKIKIEPVEHHLAHASSAYHCSGFQEKTAILGIDGKGEYATTFFGYGENGKIHKIKEFFDPDSLGGLYGAITEFLGFEMLDGEFKVMGMAPYGDASKYDFTENLHGYISAGKGFETPTQAEMAYAPGATEGFNFGLQPSTSKQYEIGLKAKVLNDTRINLAVFQITTDDELVVAGSNNGRTSYQNAGRTLRRGLELGIDSQLGEQWSTQIAYTHLVAQYDSDFTSGATLIDKGNNLPGVPKDTLFGELDWKPRDWISTALEGMYRSKVYVEDTNDQKPAPAYAVFNWRARFEQKVEHWTFHQTLRLDNLLDRQYVGSVIVGDSNNRYYEAAPGRSWYAGAGVQYQFE